MPKDGKIISNMPNGEAVKKPEIGPEIEFPPEIEKPEERPEVKVEKPPQEEEIAPRVEKPAPPAAPPPPPPRPKDETSKAIEKILEEDLGELYLKLDPASKERFRVQGDVLVSRLQHMVKTLKVKARKVLHWIRDWLSIIPGVNKYFLEQEAKIKTDKIIALAEEEKKKRQGLA